MDNKNNDKKPKELNVKNNKKKRKLDIKLLDLIGIFCFSFFFIFLGIIVASLIIIFI